ncbi:MAG: hypothetical protein IPF47_05430 [Gemmatimonadetes bacterium]|nr:hypothetical protein [Gemmatimonadota bacterium]
MLKVSVISPEQTLFEGEVESVTAPAFDGEVGIRGRSRWKAASCRWSTTTCGW